ncbi:MAG: dihydroneopterin aldolase [Bacteroidia bacterium]
MNAQRTVALNALHVTARIGVYEFERMEERPFIIDAALTMPCDIVADPVRLDESVDYEAMLALVLDELKTPEFLMESVANRLALRMKETFPVATGFFIHIQKINPPLKAEVGSSSVKLEVCF